MTPDPNVALMASIRARYGVVIDAACAGTEIEPAFLAALVANESGGNLQATRFEPAVLVSLWQVLQGRKAAFGSIGAQDLAAFVFTPVAGAANNSLAAMQRLDRLATSWGLTQIMGYNVLGVLQDPATLATPQACFRVTLQMLADFIKRFGITQTFSSNCWERLFRCWNAGSPDSATFDPNYPTLGIARAYIYEQNTPPAVSA